MTRAPMNRRSFLSASLAGAAGLGFPTRASWATPAGPGESFRLTYFTDIHARTEWDVPEAMGLAARKINEAQGDLVICGGDCITDGFQSGREAVLPRWKAYQDSLARQLKPPVRTAIGNHDLVGAIPEDGSRPEKDPRALFRKEMAVRTTYASFPAGAYHVVMLDPFRITNDEWKYHGFVDEAQRQWLRGELGKIRPETPIILVCHMPLLTSFFQVTAGQGQVGPPNRVVMNNVEVLEAFAKHRLHLVLQGHLHVNEILRWRNTTFITGGAISGKWWRGEWQGTREGFGVVTMRKDKIDWEYRNLGWEAKRPQGV
jgi:Icc protein